MDAKKPDVFSSQDYMDAEQLNMSLDQVAAAKVTLADTESIMERATNNVMELEKALWPNGNVEVVEPFSAEFIAAAAAVNPNIAATDGPNEATSDEHDQELIERKMEVDEPVGKERGVDEPVAEPKYVDKQALEEVTQNALLQWLIDDATSFRSALNGMLKTNYCKPETWPVDWLYYTEETKARSRDARYEELPPADPMLLAATELQKQEPQKQEVLFCCSWICTFC